MQTRVIFLPGLMCDGAVFEAQIAALGDRARCMVADFAALDSLPAMAGKVLKEASGDFVAVGHSMGGRVALEICRRAPERVRGLAILDTGYQARDLGDAGERERAQRMALVELARSSGMRTMGTKWVQGMVHPERLADRALVDAILDMIERKDVATFLAQQRALLDRPDASDLLREIRCPTLVMCGRDDAWSPLSRHEAMARMIPRSELAVIDRSGHMSTMERPHDVSSALIDWLSSNALVARSTQSS
jgi:pimeloyl-ACP methyl ester carboxylesterase